jgi:hypothetical protein
MLLAALLKKSKTVNSAASVWKGPCGEGPQGGITASLLARSFVCPERFRIYAVEGLRPVDGFNHRLEYGNMWHVCEEALASKLSWDVRLLEYAQELCHRYPIQQAEIDKWYYVCLTQFPLYVEWWGKHPDVKDRTPLLAEQVFDVPYPLPSGRTARLRGKLDSVDLIGKGKNIGAWLQENKSKGDIDESQLRRQLSSGFDLQTMIYLTALRSFDWNSIGKDALLTHPDNIRGVRYNVVRRPLSGGRGSIVQSEGTSGSKCNLKACRNTVGYPSRGLLNCPKCSGVGRYGARPAETNVEYMSRLADVIRDAHGPEWGIPDGEHFFFMRWNVNVLPTDIERFKRECLTPVLENLCDDFEWWEWCKLRGGKGPNVVDGVYSYTTRGVEFPEHCRRHFVTPFGVYNPLVENGATDVDEYLRTGSEVGLHQVTNLFPELSNV